MILLALALQVTAPQTAVDAERAFNAAAQSEGQWTAFRKFATDDALLFTPQPTNVHTWLRDRADPPKSVEWWPTESYVSCDGKVAANTGGWKRPDGSVGYFTTIWKRQTDGGWKWVVDHGDTLGVARAHPLDVKPTRASCGPSGARGYIGEPVVDLEQKSKTAFSSDGSLVWEWRVASDGARHIKVSFWNGREYEEVIDDKVAAPK